MTIDDPKLTAYALGEMSELSAQERLAVEALLAESAEARAFVEETAAFAETLKGEFKAESPELAPGVIETSDLLAEVNAARKVVPLSAARRVVWAVGIGAAAAAFATVFYLPLGVTVTRERGLASRQNQLSAEPEVKLAFEDVDAPFAGAKRESVGGNLVLGEEASRALVGLSKAASQPVVTHDVVPVPSSTPPAVSSLRSESFSLPQSVVSSGKAGGAVSDELIAQEVSKLNGNLAVASLAPEVSFSLPQEISVSAPSASELVATAGKPKQDAAKFAYSSDSVSAPVASPTSGTRSESLSSDERKAIATFTSGWATRGGSARLNQIINERRAHPSVNEAYPHHNENDFLSVSQQPLSTFSIDVDTASYSNVRRFLTAGQRPPGDAVRIEELLNYFRYDYAPPKEEVPFATHVEIAECPWTPENRLVKIGLKGREITREGRAASNLVFLIDVSGSMSDENKLPLLKQSMRLMVERLGEDDRVAIVVYASEAGVKLPPTRGHQKAEILAALEGLNARGATNGGEGIQQAYAAATANFIPGGINRVILATDGDFNVGTTSQAELTKLIEEKAKSGVYLTVLGFGGGNFKDDTMKMLSTKGNGNYAYIDSLREGRKVLVEQLMGTLVTIAKDVKIQVEFNPAQVSAYRLIGYENRLLKSEDFNNDKKDAGEIGAGHTVTALYEVVPAGKPGAVDGLRYQPAPVAVPKANAASGELLTVKLRYKKPDGETSLLIDHPVVDRGRTMKESSNDLRFAAAVAEFGMLLKRSPHAGVATWASAKELALSGLGEDEGGYRAEFIGLLEKAERLDGGRH